MKAGKETHLNHIACVTGERPLVRMATAGDSKADGDDERATAMVAAARDREGKDDRGVRC